MLVTTSSESITPTEHDTEVARESSEALAPLLEEQGNQEAHIRVSSKDKQGAEIILPFPAVRLLFNALQEMAKGHSVTLLPVDTELTTQQAAELMHISRPSLIKMLDEKKLPFRKVGAHRRICYEDVMRYLDAERARRKEIMKELIEETERLGLYK